MHSQLLVACCCNESVYVYFSHTKAEYMFVESYKLHHSENINDSYTNINACSFRNLVLYLKGL